MSLFLGLVAIFIITWFLIDIGWRGWVGCLTTLGVKKRELKDVSHLRLDPPPKTKENIVFLESMGFQRLGEAQASLPFRKSVNYWVLVDSANHSQAITVLGWVSLSTIFENNIIVETDFPYGETVDTPHYQSHTITTSIKDALQYHQQQTNKFRQTYGSPRPTQDMADYFQWESIARKNYSFLKFRRQLWFSIIRLITFIYGVIIITGLPIAYRARLPFLPTTLIYEQIELIIIGLTLPALFVPYLWSRFVMKSNNRFT
jgi:hypothetical protein